MRKSLETSQDEKQAFLKKAGRNRFLNFCEIVDPNYEVNWHHQIIAEKLQEAYEKLLKGISSRIIIEVPPRHGKSKEATILFPAWILGKQPEWPIIVASYSADLAETFGMLTRDVMSQNDNYRLLFDTRLRADTKAKAKWMTQKGGGYTATGVGGPITGKGFKMGIIDDPIKNREEADSETIREKIWQWWTSTFYTRQDGVSMIVAIMTRWHTDDLVARLEAQEEEMEKSNKENYDVWDYISFPAIAEENEEFRRKGEPLWPNRFSLNQLQEIENALGPYDWSALYQQQPIPLGRQEFKKEWFRYYQKENLIGKNLDYYTTIDPSMGEDRLADNSVVLTIAKERSGPNWYRIEESAGIMDADQLIDAIFYHYKKYKSKVWLETAGYQKSLKYWINEKQKKENVYFFVHELKNNVKTAKNTRIRGLIPLYATGVIYHRHGLDSDYEKELFVFPQGKHDDRIDAMASMLEAVNSTQYEDEPRIPQKERKYDPY